jgi:sugar lactone lactonase YvrE
MTASAGPVSTRTAVAVTRPVAVHGEGPVWARGRLHWVDMLAGDLLTLGADGEVTRRHVGTVLAAVRPRAAGGLVLALERGFAVCQDPEGPVRELPPSWADPRIRFNEGGCDPDGRFWCGSMAYDQTPGAATMYRLDADLTSRPVFGGLTISNGLDWSPDGTLAYYVDTATGRIDAFDYSTERGLHGRRPFVEIATGGPDGLTVDAEGGVWVALWGAGAVHRYDRHGELTDVVTVAAEQVTACTFGGPELRSLFITTSRLGNEGDRLAGALFQVADAGVRGQPARPFRG